MLRVSENSDTVLEITATNIIRAGTPHQRSMLKGRSKEIDEYSLIRNIIFSVGTIIEAMCRAGGEKPRMIVKTKGKLSLFSQFAHMSSLTSRTTKQRDIS